MTARDVRPLDPRLLRHAAAARRFAGRAVLAWAGEVAAHRASADAIGELRAALVAHVLRLGPRHRDLRPTGELATLATRGLDGLDGYSAATCRHCSSPRVVPAMVAARFLAADWLSGSSTR
ncbi:hypothetical protein [Pseudonocardia sp. H11422]|uniref:hypothetical protein n=1 Tax=Pseudonocardia sp. H11422 TaxID=2835866 RepID=UPI001BDC609F|nr:hypothetical protein [Pseudonocardia sp. H11422]